MVYTCSVQIPGKLWEYVYSNRSKIRYQILNYPHKYIRCHADCKPHKVLTAITVIKISKLIIKLQAIFSTPKIIDYMIFNFLWEWIEELSQNVCFRFLKKPMNIKGIPCQLFHQLLDCFKTNFVDETNSYLQGQELNDCMFLSYHVRVSEWIYTL